jgi:transposase
MGKYSQKLMQHSGIVAGMCDEIKMVEIIDNLIKMPKRKVTVGQAIKSMILNALGFSGRALYLHNRFYKNRPVDILIGEGLSAEDLNDDCLGSALDAIFDYGLTELFYIIASNALTTYNIAHRFVHLDTTTFSLYGKYNSEDDDDDDTQVIKITKGYSKDNNPELNQVVVSLMCAYKSSIPVWIETLSGNSSDKKSFKKSISEYRKQFDKKNLPYFVADSALYTQEGLKQLSDIKWVSRVPETLKQTKEIIERTEKDEMEPSDLEGYYYKEIEQTYADIRQRWLLVYSKKAYEREYATLAKNIRKENKEKAKELMHLANIGFACEADAVKAADAFHKTLRYHNLIYTIEVRNYHNKKGRPKEGDIPVSQEWFITGNLTIKADAIGEAQSRKGFFIIATNEMDREKISSDQLLSVYKKQGTSVERGFRFLKDPIFFAESLYLKLPKRIMALIMVMGLSLLVYSLAERKLRKVLKENNLTVSDQVGKPTASPTIRWVFQNFEDVLMLEVQKGDKLKILITNMEEDHITIVKCLGKHVEKIYFCDS